MENDDTQKGDRETSSDLSPRDSKRKTGKKNGKATSSDKKSDEQKKWSLWRHWKSASRAKQIKWIAEGIVVATGIAILGVYIWQTLQAKWTVQIEHKPLVINSRPPEFLQPFICDIRSKQLNTGNMRRFVKNIGNAQALRVNPFFGSFLKVIPEHARGDKFIDSPPVVSCNGKLASVPMEFPLAPGIEKITEVRQGAMTLLPLSADEPVQLYDSECVYYWDEYGNSHATCDTYRLLFPSTNPLDVLSGSPTFFCDGTPKMGKFQEALIGHCQQ